LQPLVASRAFAAEFAPLAMTPHDARRKAHRAAWAGALLVHGRVGAELAGPDGGDEPRHPGTGDDHVNENVGLCSTYSIRTPSGPRRNAAYVLAASTTDSTSMPSSSASATCASAESTSTARWFRSGRSGRPGSPGTSSTKAPSSSARVPACLKP